MTRQAIVSVDAGTSVIKAVAFDLTGRELGSASRRNTYKQLPDGGVEQDMRRTWRDTAATLQALSERLPGISERVLALAVTAQGDGTWLLDANNEPIHDGWLWLDARAADEARALAESSANEIVYRHTGSGINVCQMRTHLCWMKRHAPDLLARAATAMHCKDWLYLNLTGVRATDPSEAEFTFGNFRTGGYSTEAITALGLEDLRHLLPPIVDGSRQAHALTASAARATGLPEGLPVVLGAIDVMCSAIGAGICDPATEPGLTVLGSTGMHMRYVRDSDSVVLNEAQSGYTMPIPGGAFSQMQTNMAATLNIDWALGLAAEILRSEGLDRHPEELLAGLDDRVLAARPGAALFHPYISSAGERGPFTEPNARASFTGLDQSTGWFDMLRAIYDGLVLAARDCYAALGDRPGEIRVTGGAAKSPLMRRLLASSMDRPVRAIAQPEAGAAGAAMIAAVQQGVFPTIGDATAAWVLPLLQQPDEPDAELVPIYDRLFDAYLRSRIALLPVWSTQAALMRSSR